MKKDNLDDSSVDIEFDNEAAGENENFTANTDTDAQQANDAEAKLKEAEATIEAEKDKYLRKVAEFENYRKRTIKEKTELILNGGERVMTALLPILDDLERAEENIAKNDDVNALREGLELVFSKLKKTLSEQGLKRIDTEDKVFDTDFHEAVALVPAEDSADKGKILDCIQPGYMLNDKVIRHAKVAVGQ